MPWSAGPELDLMWLLLCIVLLLIMQAGFLCLESGAVRRKNTVNVAVKNVLDLCIAGTLFLIVGYGLAYGDSWGGWIGDIGSTHIDDSPGSLTRFLYLLLFCGTAVTIVSGAIAERTTLRGYLTMAALTSALIYPVMCHWAWNESGWLARLGFVDFAGSTVVHATGGWLALVACVIVGPRRDIAAGGGTLPAHNLTISSLGLLFLWIGWLGFNGGSLLGFDAAVPVIIANTVLAAIAGGVATALVSFVTRTSLRTEYLVVGIVGALVGITASVYALSLGAALGLGSLSALVGLYGYRVLAARGLDDVVGAVASHGIAGVFGTLCVPFFADPVRLGTGLDLWEQVYAQSVGVVANLVWCLGVGGVLFKAANWLVPFRASAEAEQRGMDLTEHDARNALLELSEHIRSSRDGEDADLIVDEHSDEGQLAHQFRALAQSARKARSDMESAVASKDRSDRANQAKSQFLANMSHELRTPLNGILGTLDVVLSDELEAEVGSSLRMAKDSSEHLLALLNDLLDTAKMEAGEIQLDPQPASIKHLVREVQNTFAHAAQQKGVGLEASVGVSVPDTVAVDGTRLKQILMNLVGNALKFTEAGEVVIQVNSTITEDLTHWVRFSVRDSGIGIEPEVQATIFERFKQADESTTRRFGGTGLGLALCRDLSQLMGGDIEVASVAGQGSTFTVTLPLTEASADGMSASVEAQGIAADLSMLRVLVAEDNKTNQIVMRKQLEKLGVEHHEIVEDGEAAIESWRSRTWDLILMDCQMPGVDGLQATQAIRAEEVERGLSRTVILAVTANASMLDQQECLDAGMDGHISKPIRLDELGRALTEIAQAPLLKAAL